MDILFFQHHLLKVHSSLHLIFDTLANYEMTKAMCTHVLGLQSCSTVICANFCALLFYCYYYVFMIYFKIWSGNLSNIVRFAQDYFVYLKSFVTSYEFWEKFFVVVKNKIESVNIFGKIVILTKLMLPIHRYVMFFSLSPDA